MYKIVPCCMQNLHGYLCECKTAYDSYSLGESLLSCKRWHEAEILALKTYLADEKADHSATAKSMRENFRCKIEQHKRFIKALAAVTT